LGRPLRDGGNVSPSERTCPADRETRRKEIAGRKSLFVFESKKIAVA
jgi:hypothetical protein